MLTIPDKDMRSIHSEIDDGFTQQSYFMFDLENRVVYVNYAEVVTIEVQDDTWVEHVGG